MKPNSTTTTTTTPPPPPLTVPPRGRLLVHKTLRSAANLANLLPSGTVLAFQTLAPSFSNKGDCSNTSNKYLTASLIGFCSAVCFLSCFTDSFTDCDGKQYYGIATAKGLLVLNRDGIDDDEMNVDLCRFRVSLIDFVHAGGSVLVFMAFALCDVKVQRCLFPVGMGEYLDVLVMNLPLAVGIFSTFFFIIFPTTRRGIGYSDMPATATANMNSKCRFTKKTMTTY